MHIMNFTIRYDHDHLEEAFQVGVPITLQNNDTYPGDEIQCYHRIHWRFDIHGNQDDCKMQD